MKIVEKLKLITVEPLLLLFGLSCSLMSTTDAGLWYRKVCLSLYPGEEELCNSLASSNLTAQDNSVQQTTSKWQAYHSAIYNITALLMALVYGSISDSYSRKIPMITPSIGLILECVVKICCYTFEESPLALMLLPGLLAGLSGGMSSFFMAVTSFVTDGSLRGSRTTRISLLYSAAYTATFIGCVSSGYVIDYAGFVTSYCIVMALGVCSILYVVFLVPKNVNSRSSSKNLQETQTAGCDSDTKSRGELDDALIDSGQSSIDAKNPADVDDALLDSAVAAAGTTDPATPRCRFLVQFICNLPKHFYDALATVLKPRDNGHRKYIILLMCSVFFFMSGRSMSLTYLFLRHPPLSFSQVLYGYYEGANTAISALGLLFVIPTLKTVTKCSDMAIATAGMITSISKELIKAFSTTVWMIFLAVVVGFLDCGIFPSVRGSLSNLVSTQELGKVFAVLGGVENIAMLASEAFYNYYLYPATVALHPGFCYFIEAIMGLIPLSIFIYLNVSFRRNLPYQEVLQADVSQVETPHQAAHIN